MSTTSIEWTEQTWNPIGGCTPVSPGCLNCYAAKMAYRLEMMGQAKYRGLTVLHNGRRTFNGKINFDDDALTIPLKRTKPTTYFVNSMSDLFHEAVPFEFVDKVFAVMALCPQHTFQVLTKRPERMAEYTSRGYFPIVDAMQATIDVHTITKAVEGGAGGVWPIRNVWLGTSVENQKTANERIPHLLKCPAKVRFLSCEPLLEEIDLVGWGEARASFVPMPDSWDDYAWPNWIPAEERRQIVEFYGKSSRRLPSDWAKDNVSQRTPATGSRVGVCYRESQWIGWICKEGAPEAKDHGRWIHSWNNMGRVVTDDGRTLCASASRGPGWLSRWLESNGEYRHRIHLVIVGGESGPNARPMHPQWARSLRDQCVAAGVPYFFKQHGEYRTTTLEEAEADDPRTVTIKAHPDDDDSDKWPMTRVGKKSAGRLLDGREWNEMPGREVSHA